MAFCTHCGAPVPDGARFCTKCGSPIAAAPAAPQTGPQQPPYQGQPVQAQPVRPAQPAPPPDRPAAPSPQGIVIDAPEGATVTISDAPPQETSVQAPAEKGEFVLVQWDKPKQEQQPRAQGQQAPQYRQPQYPQQPQQQTYRQPYQQPRQQPYQQPPQPPKRRRRGGCLSTLLVLAVLIGAGIYLYPKYSSFIPPEIRAYIEQIIGKPVTTHPETLAGITFDLDDGFSVTDQYPLDGGANVVLAPVDVASDTDMMQLILLPGILDGADDMPAGQLATLLKDSVRKMADNIAGNYGLDLDYPVTFDESKVFPIAYATFDGEDGNGNPFHCHAETVLRGRDDRHRQLFRRRQREDAFPHGPHL